jgi:hypothetical protein
VHAYGAPDGYFEWAFATPERAAARARLRLRLSSEWPGTFAPPDGGSRVRALLDGQLVGELEVVPDDGAGQVYELPIEDAALVGALAAGGVHRLRLEVPPGPHAIGVCVYGAATGHGPAPSGEITPIALILNRSQGTSTILPTLPREPTRDIAAGASASGTRSEMSGRTLPSR